MFNCCLINLEDMLANGTVINGKKIDTPKSFQVACTVTTQMSPGRQRPVRRQSIAASTVSWHRHHDPSKVHESRRRLAKVYSIEPDMERPKKSPEADEGNQGRYPRPSSTRCDTLMTTNGQAPFITLFVFPAGLRIRQKRPSSTKCFSASGIREANVYVTAFQTHLRPGRTQRPRKRPVLLFQTGPLNVRRNACIPTIFRP